MSEQDRENSRLKKNIRNLAEQLLDAARDLSLHQLRTCVPVDESAALDLEAHFTDTQTWIRTAQDAVIGIQKARDVQRAKELDEEIRAKWAKPGAGLKNLLREVWGGLRMDEETS